jgi:hypothetical protein
MRRAEGFIYFLTLTAPGDNAHSRRMSSLPNMAYESFPFAQQGNRRTADLPPGREWCPCTPRGGVDLAEWNADHSRRWNHFRTVLRRDFADGAEFFRGIEVQKRGALHDHALIWSPVVLSESELRELAIRCGFGHEVKLERIEPGSKKSAFYVSKYVSKSADSREMVPWVGDKIDKSTGEVTRGRVVARYRTWSASRGWGSRLGEIRAAAAAYARGVAAAAELVDQAAVVGMVSVVATSAIPPPDVGNSSPPA